MELADVALGALVELDDAGADPLPPPPPQAANTAAMEAHSMSLARLVSRLLFILEFLSM
ncbi:hypothetical protein P0D88_06145 [Paraburkholderia sp. RL18-103-BIB-C]|uniref:hypothetical protein n=1 Tax=Paraburkholderia sp. RL18-103-BIB-C TaxID=3031637 RepID=UPI0038BACF11